MAAIQRRLWLVLGLAIASAGCGSPAPSPSGFGSLGTVGCYPSYIEGDLVGDQGQGTAIDTTPIVWPKGYTVRPSGPEREVLDETGHVVARTGTRVHLGGGLVGHPSAFQACPEPDPEVVP